MKAVYLVLAARADNRTRIAKPAQDTLAADVCISERALRTALKVGAEAGLWDVIHTQKQNLYRLRDLGRGWVPGSGPLTPRVLPAKVPPGTTCRMEDVPGTDEAAPTRHILPAGPAHGADRLDTRTRQKKKTTTTPAARVRSLGRAHDKASPLKPSVTIQRPKWLDDHNADEITSYVLSAAPAAVRKQTGHKLGRNTGDVLRRHLLPYAQTRSPEQVLAEADRILNAALTGEPDWAHLLLDHTRKPRGGAPTDPDELIYHLDYMPGAESTVDSMLAAGWHPNAIEARMLKQNGYSA